VTVSLLEEHHGASKRNSTAAPRRHPVPSCDRHHVLELITNPSKRTTYIWKRLTSRHVARKQKERTAQRGVQQILRVLKGYVELNARAQGIQGYSKTSGGRPETQ